VLGLNSPTSRLNVKFSVGFMNSDWFKPGCGWNGVPSFMNSDWFKRGCGWNGVPSAFREPKGD
jgi:hypothetical protein